MGQDQMVKVPPAAGAKAAADSQGRFAAGEDKAAAGDWAGSRPASRGQTREPGRRRKNRRAGIRRPAWQDEQGEIDDAGDAVAENRTVQSSPVQGEQVKILLATADNSRFADLAAGLSKAAAVQLFWAQTAAEVMELLAGGGAEIVVIDDHVTHTSGIALARILAARHPFVNSALVSSLPATEFHEQTEGLGVLMKLSNPPLQQDGEALLAHYASIQSTWRQGEERDSREVKK